MVFLFPSTVQAGRYVTVLSALSIFQKDSNSFSGISAEILDSIGTCLEPKTLVISPIILMIESNVRC